METIHFETNTPPHSMMIGGKAILNDVTSLQMSKNNFEEYFREGVRTEWHITQRGSGQTVKITGVIIGYRDSGDLTLTIQPVP